MDTATQTQDQTATDIAANLQAAGAKAGTVKERLAQYKADSSGTDTFTLDETGVVVTLPKFKPYSAWVMAQRLGGKDQERVQEYYIIALCRFDDEKLTADDYRDLIPAPDHLQIVGAVFSGAKDKAKAAAAPAGDAEGK
ncbi:MAG: hypothetical protein KGL46_04035 [Hyphomicrobiales bacterium]|nr:hypothetical protein [Hyphomicrobiales bacterium]